MYEYLSVDTSEDMENFAKKLRRGSVSTAYVNNPQIKIVLSYIGGTKSGKELIKNVYYKRYIPMSGQVCRILCRGCH